MGPADGRDRAHRPRLADEGRQALAAVPDRVRLPGAARRSATRRSPTALRKRRRRRRVLPQGVADPRRHRGRRRRRATARRRCTPSTACRSRSTSATSCSAKAIACSATLRRAGRGEGRDAARRRRGPSHADRSARAPSCCWARAPKPLTSLQVLDIFRRKTAPAFEVALRVGGALAGASEDVRDVFAQVQRGARHRLPDPRRPRRPRPAPTRPTTSPRCARRCRWRSASSARRPGRRGARRAPRRLAARHQRHARGAARPADRAERRGALPPPARVLQGRGDSLARRCSTSRRLKGLLRRVVGKIFNDIEMKGWCSEFEARNAAGRAAGADAAAVTSADLVGGFLRERYDPDGGFRNRAGDRDLYYTVFGLEGLAALRAPIDADAHAARYLTGVRRRRGARLRPSELPGPLLGQPARAACRRPTCGQRMLDRIATFRAGDGGFATDPGGDEGSAYGAFVALGAYQDLREPVPDGDALMAQLLTLVAADGGLNNFARRAGRPHHRPPRRRPRRCASSASRCPTTFAAVAAVAGAPAGRLPRPARVAHPRPAVDGDGAPRAGRAARRHLAGEGAVPRLHRLAVDEPRRLLRPLGRRRSSTASTRTTACSRSGT